MKEQLHILNLFDNFIWIIKTNDILLRPWVINLIVSYFF